MAECGKYLGGTTSFPCTIEINRGDGTHDGPCMAKEVARSVRERSDWEKAQTRVQAERASGKDEGLSAFQGRPETFAERMGERDDRPGATPLTTAPTASQGVRTFEVGGVEPVPTRFESTVEVPTPEKIEQVPLRHDAIREAYEHSVEVTTSLRQVIEDRDAIIAALNVLEARLKAMFGDVLPEVWTKEFDLLYDLLAGRRG